jgi:predicted transcriptional regulator
MEKVGKIPMEQLHETSERIWKVLSQFSQGTTVKSLQQITSLSDSTIYEALKELRSKGYVVKENKLYKIKAANMVISQKEIGPNMANAIIYNRILATQFNCKAAGDIANILEDLCTKFNTKK